MNIFKVLILQHILRHILPQSEEKIRNTGAQPSPSLVYDRKRFYFPDI